MLVTPATVSAPPLTSAEADELLVPMNSPPVRLAVPPETTKPDVAETELGSAIIAPLVRWRVTDAALKAPPVTLIKLPSKVLVCTPPLKFAAPDWRVNLLAFAELP